MAVSIESSLMRDPSKRIAACKQHETERKGLENLALSYARCQEFTGRRTITKAIAPSVRSHAAVRDTGISKLLDLLPLCSLLRFLCHLDRSVMVNDQSFDKALIKGFVRGISDHILIRSVPPVKTVFKHGNPMIVHTRKGIGAAHTTNVLYNHRIKL